MRTRAGGWVLYRMNALVARPLVTVKPVSDRKTRLNSTRLNCSVGSSCAM
jgi:hypothetical protein